MKKSMYDRFDSDSGAQELLESLQEGQPQRRFGPATQRPEVLAKVFAGQSDALPGIGGKLLQIGGDASTGRGLVLVQACT
jgi:CRISPR/Cas system CMR subunit Cmr4 (Cas7 group RAMP superfamily)